MSSNNNEGYSSLEGSDTALPDMVDWTVRDVSRWIADIGHAQYCENFEEHDINGECLVKMTHRLLRDLEVESVGHRISILNAISDAQPPRYPLQREQYVPPPPDATCVPIAQYRTLESIFKKCEQQIEGMGRELRRSKEEVAVAWELLAEEIEKGAEVKTELLRIRRVHHRLCRDKGIQTDAGFLEFLKWRDEMKRDVKDVEKESTSAGDSTGHLDATVQAPTQDIGGHQQPMNLSRGREEFETFDQRISAPFQKASTMLEHTLKALKVHENHQDWDLWVRYGNRQIRLKPDDLPVKMCRDFRMTHKAEEVMILARHKDACKGSGYILRDGP
ncbi:Adaptor for signal transduction [Arthrobotrys conoides]|uniref:Adaptor for signal transduction n=1 Tax=Arthrobotrys conoides TaxID=74498 RepID=A0AAN8N4P2_9PEZI